MAGCYTQLRNVSLGEYRDMEAKPSRSKRPLIIITVIFIIIIVIVGAVVWKVTKDAYDSDTHVKEIKSDQDGNESTGDGGGDDGNDDDDEELTEEELKLKPWKRLRLPKNILPVHYDITMYPNFYDGAAEFYGNETIELNVTSPSQYLFVHVDKNYINILDVEVVHNASGLELAIKNHFIYEKNQFLVIEGDRPFTDVVKVSLSFEGTLNKSIVGIYKSSYVNSLTKQTRYLATSKFEPTYARRAFPCLDEPNLKATYKITIVHRPEYKALSNMDVGLKQPWSIDPTLTATHFSKSVKMSTYLVCFIVCDFESVEATSNKGTKIQVFATPDKTALTSYALEMAKYTLDLYEQLFEIDYPLPKQDLIAIPDFVSGAMEHWGLITFRESALLYSPTTSTLSSKKRVAQVVAHEMAHQWFGNLVTMDWWNDLWLNEGFASFMEYMGAKDKEKDWDLMSQFLVDDLLPVMESDAVINTHPIVVNVNDPAQITSIFDSISYSKGASVIRMMEAIVGPKDFFQGIAQYLKKFKWGNAKTDDLWQSLSSVTSLDVKSIMDTWTIQDGFPYVNITMSTTDNTKTTLQASQTRFMSDPTAEFQTTSSPFGYKWYIPLDYNTSLGVSGRTIMDKGDATFEVAIDLSKQTNWIKFNKDKNGFYRVLYPDQLWSRLADYLTNTKPQDWTLSPSDRADLLNDAFQLAAAGLTSYKIPMTLTSYLSQESHYVPWLSVLRGGLEHIRSMLQDDSDYGVFKSFLLKRIQPTLTRLGFQDTGSFLQRQLRSQLFELACVLDEKTAMDNARLQFRDWLDKDIKPSVNLRSVVYTNGMRDIGTEKDWSAVWSKYLVETAPSEKGLLLSALTSTKDPSIIAKLLQFAMEEKGIRSQDFFTVVRLLGNNRYATHVVWDWMRDNYSAIEKRFTSGHRYFGRMAYYLVKQFKTERKLQEVQTFFSQHQNVGSSARYRKMANESIQRNIYWMKHSRVEVIAWVKENDA